MRVARSDRRAILTRAHPQGIKDVPTGTESQCVIRKGHVNVEEQLTSSSKPGRSWDQRLAGPRHRLGDQRQRVPDEGRLPADAQPRSQHGEGGDHLRENELPVREILRGSAECEPPSSSLIPRSLTSSPPIFFLSQFLSGCYSHPLYHPVHHPFFKVPAILVFPSCTPPPSLFISISCSVSVHKWSHFVGRSFSELATSTTDTKGGYGIQGKIRGSRLQ